MAAPIVLGITIRADGSAQVRRELGHVRDELNGAGHAAQGVNRQFADMARETLNVGSALRSMMAVLSAAALYQFAKEVVSTADQMKLLDSRLKVATSSVQDYAESQKELVAMSLRTGTAFEANASMFSRVNKSMEAMGGTARDTAVMTELIAKSLSLSGASAGEANSVIRQLSQAMASGVLRGDEFNSIMENGSRLAYALSAGIGVNVGELRKMAEAGELTSAKVIKAIMSQSAAINDEFSRMPLTVGAALENIKTAWGQYILQADAGTGATASLANQFNNLAKNLGPVIDTLIQVGTVAATVFAGQMLTSLGKYTAAQVSAIALEHQHGQAIRMNHAFNVQAAAARLAQTQVEIANTQAMLAGNLAMGVRMGLTNQLNVLTAAQTAQTAALSSATSAAAAAQRGLTAAFAINPFTGLIVSLSILVGLLINAKTQLRDLSAMSIDDKITQAREGIEKQKSRIETAKGPIGLLISDEQLAREQAKLKLMKDELGRYYKERDLLKEQERKQSKLAEIKTPSAEELKLAEKAEKARQKALEATARGIKAEMDALHEQHLKLTLSERDYYAATLAAKGMSAAQAAVALATWDANQSLEAQKVSSDKAKSEMDALIDKYNELTLSARDYYAAKLKADGLSPAQSAPLLVQFDKNTALEASKKKTEDARSALDEYASSLNNAKKEMTGLGSVSSAVFDGALGGVNALSGAFSNMVGALQENTQALSTLREKQSLNELDKENKNYQKNVISFEKEAARLKQENLNASIDGIMQIAGASSKMFEQNSEEAKAMNLVVLGGLAAKAAAAMLTQGTGDPYTAFARIAAMGSLVAGIMSAAGAGGFDFSGGGSAPAPVGSSGIGTVLGDSEAKSASVNNTYELLQDIHAKEYATLRSIDQGIYNLQSGITDVITRLFQAGGINVPTIDGKAKYAVDMQALNLTIGGPLGHMVEFAKKLPVIGGLISGIEDFVIGGLFGKTTRSVTGSGIGSNPTSLMDIMNGGDIAGYQYATIETKKKSWFSTKKSYSEQQMALDEATQDALTRVFKGMGQTMYGLAEQLGHDTKQKVENYVIPAMKVELHGLSGEDAAKKFNDVISASLDTMSETVFGEILGQYQQLGEGMLETTTRIVSEIAIVQDSLRQSGVSLTGDVIAISDAIVQAAGGLKEFQSAFEQAFDKFASDGAKLQRRIESLQGQLLELFPQSTIDRLAMGRDEYARLAGSLDQTNPRYAEQYAMLVKLAESADQYYSAMEDLAAAYQENQKTIEQLTTQYERLNGSDLQKQLWGLQDSFLNTIATIIANGGQLVDIMAVVDIALKTGTDALEKAKYNLEKTFSGIFDAITQERLSISDNILKLTSPDALADVQKERAYADLQSDNYEKQMAAVTTLQNLIMQGYSEQAAAAKNIIDYVKQIKSYVDGLKVNDQLSPLSHEERLNEARAQFSTQLALAQTGDQDALSKITQFADEYLGEARNYFASSADYAAIFSNVTSALTGLSGLTPATPEEQTAKSTQQAVEELQSINAILDKIQQQQAQAQADQLNQMGIEAEAIKNDFLDAIYELEGASAILIKDMINNIVSLRSELADLVMNIDFTTNLPDDLHTLMVMASNSFKVSIDLALDPASTLTQQERSIALGMTQNSVAMLKMLLDPASTLKQEEKNIATATLLNSAVLLNMAIDPASTWTSEEKEIAMGTSHTYQALVDIQLSSASDITAKALAMATSNTIDTAVKVALDPGYDSEAKQLALATTNSISALVKVATDQTSSQDAKTLALNTENSINTVVKALMDPASSADAKAIALNNLNTINSMVNPDISSAP
jgi:tape measure domain-containing protein